MRQNTAEAGLPNTDPRLTHRVQQCEKCGTKFMICYLGKPKNKTVQHNTRLDPETRSYRRCGHVQPVKI